MNRKMKYALVACGAGIWLTGSLGVSFAYSDTGLLFDPALQSGPAAPYWQAVNHQLTKELGRGGFGRSLYCDGPAVIGFQILPDGHVAHIKVLRQSAPPINAGLAVALGNMTFPKFYQNMPRQPITMIYRYNMSPWNRLLEAPAYNCR